jgi:hypothetical protein
MCAVFGRRLQFESQLPEGTLDDLVITLANVAERPQKTEPPKGGYKGVH